MAKCGTCQVKKLIQAIYLHGYNFNSTSWQNTVHKTLECIILRVGDSYRVTLPQPFAKRVGWITGDQSHKGWMLVGGPGRCRLLSAAEVDNDPNLQSLRNRIAAEVAAPNPDSLEFQDETLAGLALRLVPVEIKPRPPGWRLALPTPIAAIMQIRPQESDVAAVFLQDHIEFWTIGTLRASVTTPLTQII
jgi:hypothetical protein